MHIQAMQQITSVVQIIPENQTETENPDADVSVLIYDAKGKDKDLRPLGDSGATHHLVPSVDYLVDVRQHQRRVAGVSGKAHTTHIGTYNQLPGDPLYDVLVLPSAARPIVSIGKLIEQHGGRIDMNETEATHISPSNVRTVLGPRTQEGWYRFEKLPSTATPADDYHNGPYSTYINEFETSLSTINQLKREKLWRLHENLGHAPAGVMREVLLISPQLGLTAKDVKLFSGKCEACALGKPRRQTHSTAVQKPMAFGTHVHSDNTVTQPVQTFYGETVGNVCVERYANWVYGLPIKSKAKTVERLRYVCTQELHGKVNRIRSDQGGEYLNKELAKLVEEIGAVHETSASGVSQQNGAAEKCIQDVMGMTRKQLAAAMLPMTFWGESFKYACFHKNRLPCYANPDNQSPYFMRFGKHPDYSRMQPFGQACVIRLPKKKLPGIGSHGLKGIMLGYDDDDGTKAYRIYIPSKRVIAVSPHVTFMDYKAKTGYKPDPSILLGKDPNDIIKNHLPNMVILDNIAHTVEGKPAKSVDVPTEEISTQDEGCSTDATESSDNEDSADDDHFPVDTSIKDNLHVGKHQFVEIPANATKPKASKKPKMVTSTSPKKSSHKSPAKTVRKSASKAGC